MRCRVFPVGLLTLSILNFTAHAQAPESNDQAAPSVERLRAAVSSLPAGRVSRPDSYDAMTPAQKEYLEGVLRGPRSAISGPLVVMLPSPELGNLMQRTMAYARFAGTEGASSVPPKFNELAVIMAAKLWSSVYVWEAHYRYAVRVGLPPALVEAVRTGTPPPRDLEPGVDAVYRFLNEFLTTKQVSDATFREARTALGGDRQLVDLIGTLAIYQMSAMLTAVDRTGLKADAAPTLRPLD